MNATQIRQAPQTGSPKNCALIGVPTQAGTRMRGCLMGPDAMRTAGLADILMALGHHVTDLGNLRVTPDGSDVHDNVNIHSLAEARSWIKAIAAATYESAQNSDMTIVLGGDHSIAAGTVPALAKHAQDCGQPFFMLWLDAHPDMHQLTTTQSGNLHGTPVAYMLGCDGFQDHFPPLLAPVTAENICMMGIRSVDRAERRLIEETGVIVHDMRAIDEQGISVLLRAFLDRVAAANGRLHVSLDVDFLDPDIACAVGTTVPGGATFREAHLIMEMVHDSGLAYSLDIAELNPALDEQSKTARLMVDLTASLMGRSILDRPTRAH